MDHLQEIIAAGRAHFDLRFAFLPKRMSNDRWIWFWHYADIYQLVMCEKLHYRRYLGRLDFNDVIFPQKKPTPRIALLK